MHCVTLMQCKRSEFKVRSSSNINVLILLQYSQIALNFKDVNRTSKLHFILLFCFMVYIMSVQNKQRSKIEMILIHYILAK